MKGIFAILTAVMQKAFDPFRSEEDRGFDTYEPKQNMKAPSGHLVAICVGHSRDGDNGATSVDDTSEWEYNSRLAVDIHNALFAMGVDSFVVSKYEGKGYGAAMRWISSHVEKRHASLAIELHFNAATGTAKGHEWLYWSTSSRSKRLASLLRDAFIAAFPAQRSRGAVAKTSGDRGAEFLRLTHCPAVICEPFFGDTPSEWNFALANKEKIGDAIATGIVDFLNS
jgi:N-acetylmuramoyl-L-alanine amidase